MAELACENAPIPTNPVGENESLLQPGRNYEIPIPAESGRQPKYGVVQRRTPPEGNPRPARFEEGAAEGPKKMMQEALTKLNCVGKQTTEPKWITKLEEWGTERKKTTRIATKKMESIQKE